MCLSWETSKAFRLTTLDCQDWTPLVHEAGLWSRALFLVISLARLQFRRKKTGITTKMKVKCTKMGNNRRAERNVQMEVSSSVGSPLILWCDLETSTRFKLEAKHLMKTREIELEVYSKAWRQQIIPRSLSGFSEPTQQAKNIMTCLTVYRAVKVSQADKTSWAV